MGCQLLVPQQQQARPHRTVDAGWNWCSAEIIGDFSSYKRGTGSDVIAAAVE
jgi:hypothetical protein